MRIWVVIVALFWAAHSTGSHRDPAVGDAAPGSLGDAPARAPAFSSMNDEHALPDFASIRDVSAKKAAFYTYMLPLIREANAEVARERTGLLAMRDALLDGRELDAGDLRALATLERRYRLDGHNTWVARRVGDLLRRVDVVPESLVLAQAAKESGWGTSRFAREGNNLFGIWCFSAGCGLTPLARAEHLAHEVQRFDAVGDGVRHYLRTINTHEAYRTLRAIRAQARRDNATLHGELLAAGLERYSERGIAYVREIQSMIRYNRLQRFTEVFHSA
tara:strand:+ start:1131 stop:1958 length:828 start_codon:yes stop_codon:yes gene_type:complete